MLGARDVAFPRLNLLSVYLYAPARRIALWGMIHGGATTPLDLSHALLDDHAPTRVVPVLLASSSSASPPS
jgi:cytochrome c oxidase subunit 1